MEYKSIRGKRIFLLSFLVILIITDIVSYFVFGNIINTTKNNYREDRYKSINEFSLNIKKDYNSYNTGLDYINAQREIIEKKINQYSVYGYYITDSSFFPLIVSNNFNYDKKYIRNFLLPLLKDDINLRYFVKNDEIYTFKIENLSGNAVFVLFVYKSDTSYVDRIFRYFVIYKIILIIFLLSLSISLIRAIEKPMAEISSAANSLSIDLKSDSHTSIVRVFKDAIDELIRVQKEDRKSYDEMKLKMMNVEENEKNIEGLMKLSEITNGIAHQMNNQLGASIGIMQIAIKNNDRILFDKVQKELERLSEFTKKFIDFARTQNPAFDDFELKTIIMKNIDRFPLSAVYEIPEEDIIVSTDEILFEQILINLFDNITKYTDRKEVKVIIKNLPTGVRLEIIDSGPGYPDSILNNLYSPFLSEAKGYGLGIPTMFKISSILNHGIEITNDNGTGKLSMMFKRSS